MRKLRWFAMCNEFGVWTETVLQYWDDDEKRWFDVPNVTCKTWEEEEYIYNEYAI
jgi:hypothetical protein